MFSPTSDDAFEEIPITRAQAKATAFSATWHLAIYYGLAVGAWGLALKKSLVLFSLSGLIAGLLISLVFVVPVISAQRTAGRTKELMFAVGAIWGFIALAVGVLGILVWLVRAVFF
jgi:hypothetical protein